MQQTASRTRKKQRESRESDQEFNAKTLTGIATIVLSLLVAHTAPI